VSDFGWAAVAVSVVLASKAIVVALRASVVVALDCTQRE
jgi:hypothetical protein